MAAPGEMKICPSLAGFVSLCGGALVMSHATVLVLVLVVLVVLLVVGGSVGASEGRLATPDARFGGPKWSACPRATPQANWALKGQNKLA